MKNIKGLTVRVTLSKKATDTSAIDKYGDIWQVFAIGEQVAVLMTPVSVWTPDRLDIKEVELEDGSIYQMRECATEYKYPNFLYE